MGRGAAHGVLAMGLDRELFLWINSSAPHAGLDLLARALSMVGSWPAGLLALGLLWWVVPGPGFPRVAGRYLMGIAVFAIVLAGLKQGIDASRPAQRLHPEIVAGTLEVRLLEEDPPMRHSFPSGHTALAFYACLWVGAERRRWLLPGILLATAIAWSRVYAGVHFPLDCLGGAVVGAVGMVAMRWGLPDSASNPPLGPREGPSADK